MSFHEIREEFDNRILIAREAASKSKPEPNNSIDDLKELLAKLRENSEDDNEIHQRICQNRENEIKGLESLKPSKGHKEGVGARKGVRTKKKST